MSVARLPLRAPAKLSGTALLGTVLVIALVAALPAALALCPVDTLCGDGAGAGTGDLVAAALSGLDRDLHAPRFLPAHTRHPLAMVPVLAATPWPVGDRSTALAAAHRRVDAPPRPAEVLAGPGADGFPFRL